LYTLQGTRNDVSKSEQGFIGAKYDQILILDRIELNSKPKIND
jgi:hypothetical protein